jgi:hypothetical protein
MNEIFLVEKSASFGHGSLVCGLWLAGVGLGGSVPTYVLGTLYILFFTWATVYLFWVKPTVTLFTLSLLSLGVCPYPTLPPYRKIDRD